MKITLMHCPKSPNGLIGLYKDGELVATQDNTSTKEEVDYCIQCHGGPDCEIQDSKGDYTSVDTLPKELVYSKPIEVKPAWICPDCDTNECLCDAPDKPAKKPAKKSKSAK